ncbi:sodium-dependent nutrient amino acid transporter 1-like [Wyeomyia smithii]|uniref:sodium-dependent nutrient amino acid transporter 1-like n=1 Tax=Wyeomyia smithii TaxID=174621 RepID=UPI002467E90E|nr:sodium-dependent nutrient amino acid transporter 1-like [Wyeomyia smithii]
MSLQNSVTVEPVVKSSEKLGDATTTVAIDSGVKNVQLNGIKSISSQGGVLGEISTDDCKREKWSTSIEFLLSCVALSVGFGNVWRFPYTALQNGGGAFLIPYLIVLFVVGRPIYYLEMVFGQFSSRGCVKVFDVCPLMRGIGVGQTITMFTIVGYYAAVLALLFVNSFKQHFQATVSSNIYRDATIISILDTLTSIISGVIVFGVVGNLAHVTHRDVPQVMKSGPQLTFITYPDAIAKMDFAPNFFAVMFFLMFILLGLGSNTGIVTTILTSVRDRYPQVTTWKAVLVISVGGFCSGLVYITPGGLTMLDLIDYYGVTFATLTLVILELVTFCWIYGVNRICFDIQFMLGIKTGIFWKICWTFLTLLVVGTIFILEVSRYQLKEVPLGFNVFGWCLYSFTVLQVLGWAAYAMWKRPERRIVRKFILAAEPTEDWGPESATLKNDYEMALRRCEDSTGLDSKAIITRLFKKFHK